MPYTKEQEAIFTAAEQGNVEQVTDLLAKNADLTLLCNDQERLALHCALLMPFCCDASLKERKCRIALLLMEKSPESLEAKDASGKTPIYCMAEQGLDSLLSTAIQLNPEAAFIPTHAGESPIHVAIANGHTDCVSTLLTVEGMESIHDNHQRNLLHYAAEFNQPAILELLKKTTLDIQSAIGSEDDGYATPRDIARSHHNREILEWLEENSPPTNSPLT